MAKSKRPVAPIHPAVRQFRRLAAGYLAASHRLFPQTASARGLAKFDPELGANDAATHQRYTALLAETLTGAEVLPDHVFAGDDWLDRRAFLSHLRTSHHWNGPLARWRTNPQVHCDAALDSILLLLIRNADRLPKIRPAIESRLAKIPRFLAEGTACLRAPVPLWTRLARQSCAGAKSFFDDLARQLAPLSPQPARFRRLCTAAPPPLSTTATRWGGRRRVPRADTRSAARRSSSCSAK